MMTLLQALNDEDESGLAFSPPKTDKRHNMRGMGKTQVLLAKDEITEALAYGYPVLRIWATLYQHNRTTLKYDTFRAHVNKLIKDTNTHQAITQNTVQHTVHDKAKPTSSKQKKTASTNAQRNDALLEKEQQKNTFSYNPIPNPDELY